jgi:hypothetical protein
LSPLKEIAEETPATVPSHPTRFTKKIRRNTKISPKTKIAAEQQKPPQQRILKPFLPIRKKKKRLRHDNQQSLEDTYLQQKIPMQRKDTQQDRIKLTDSKENDEAQSQ